MKNSIISEVKRNEHSTSLTAVNSKKSKEMIEPSHNLGKGSYSFNQELELVVEDNKAYYIVVNK